MLGRLFALLDSIRSSLWFWPVILSLGGIFLAQGTIYLDHSGRLADVESVWLFGSGIASARVLLATIAAAMISIAATVFSVTIVALTLAAGQMGPRLLRTFMRDRGTQAALGMFIATFAYCVSVLSAVDASGAETFVPRASTSTALALGMTSLAVLIYFIHHLAASIQAPTVIDVVGAELDDSIDRLFPDAIGTGEPALSDEDLPPNLISESSTVPAPESGYVQLIDGDALVTIARDAGGLVWLSRSPGDHVIAGTELARVWPGAGNTPDVSRRIVAAVVCGPTRLAVQDPLYLVNQLVEMAQRALSPGINDPTTTEGCIDRLGVALANLLQREIPSQYRRDKDGELRLIARGASFPDFVAAVFDPIRNYSRTCRQVSLRLAVLIAELAPLTRNASQRRELLEQAGRLQRAAADLPEPHDRQAVELACERAVGALEIAGRKLPGIGAMPALVLALAMAFAMPNPPFAADNGAPEGAAADTPPATIALQSDAKSDADIARRLRQLYANVAGLETISVEVSAGVVEVSGEINSRAAQEQAVGLARRIEGVVEVRDKLVGSRDLGARLYPTFDRLVDQLAAFVALLPLLAVALVVVVLFWWLARTVSGSGIFQRLFSGNPFLRDLARQVVRLAVIAAGIVLALEILDAARVLTTLLGAAGILGLALGFALRDTVENYIASLLLSLRQPFAHDDHVIIEDCEGRVVRLTPRATILMTLDGNHTRIPNAKVYKAIIVNYTRNPKRRFHFDVGVDTEQNLSDAQELAARTLVSMDGILEEPAAYCTVETLGDSNVVLRVFAWVNQDNVDFNKARSEAIRLVKRAFDQAGIVMPEPIYNLRMRTQTPAASTGGAASTAMPRAAESVSTTTSEEPDTATDIGRKDDLDQQIAADRNLAGDDDLLSAQAPKE